MNARRGSWPFSPSCPGSPDRRCWSLLAPLPAASREPRARRPIARTRAPGRDHCSPCAAARRPTRTRHPRAKFDLPPPAPSSALHALYRTARPPRLNVVLAWVRAGVHASTLASLAQAYLQASDAHAIERLLRAGHHDQAAKHFCERFSERHFPLEYAYSGRGDLIVELTGGIQHEGYADNWEEIGDLWALKPVFLLSWALTEDPVRPAPRRVRPRQPARRRTGKPISPLRRGA